jgi:hypothetical protein
VPVHPQAQRLRSADTRPDRLLYGVLAAALFLLMVSETVTQTVDGSWMGDFWEHSAVVRELARHLLHPHHPVLAVDEPHAFFSPYALVLGVFSRVTGVSAVTVLGLAGIANLALLLAVLPRFVRLFTNEALAPFLALLFTLFLWGRHPLVYSGFFHFDVIGLVLPYPSTFATAVTLWAAVVWAEHLERPRPWHIAVVASSAAVVLLTHPVVAFFLVALLVALSAARFGTGTARPAALAAVGGAMLVAAAAWPYYPFFGLLRDQGVFDLSNKPLYESMLVQVFPALFGVPVLASRLRRRRRDPLTLVFAALVVVYAIGDATSRWSLGRVLPYGVLLLDIALAGQIAAWLGRRRVVPALVFAVALVAVATPLMTLQGPAARMLPPGILPSVRDRYRAESVGSEYGRLFAGVSRASVTIASEPAGWVVPTYGGRIVAPLHPQPFVADLAQRGRDARTFFAEETTDGARQRLLCRYDARYVLVDTRESGVTPDGLSGVARTVRSVGPYVLLQASRRCVHGG